MFPVGVGLVVLAWLTGNFLLFMIALVFMAIGIAHSHE